MLEEKALAVFKRLGGNGRSGLLNNNGEGCYETVPLCGGADGEAAKTLAVRTRHIILTCGITWVSQTISKGMFLLSAPHDARERAFFSPAGHKSIRSSHKHTKQRSSVLLVGSIDPMQWVTLRKNI